MSAGQLDITIEQGATFTLILTWKTAAGAAIDLTTYTARMKIKETKSSTTVIKSLTSVSGITLGGIAGTITIVISSTDTAAFTFDNAVYDLELIDGSGVVTRLLEGNVVLSREVTT